MTLALTLKLVVLNERMGYELVMDFGAGKCMVGHTNKSFKSFFVEFCRN